MANKRLSDTGALQMPIPSSESESCSVSVEKIDNGYLTRTTRYGGTNGGQYQCTTRYTADKPVIVNSVDVAEGASPDGGNAMARAKAYLQGR